MIKQMENKWINFNDFDKRFASLVKFLKNLSVI